MPVLVQQPFTPRFSLENQSAALSLEDVDLDAWDSRLCKPIISLTPASNPAQLMPFWLLGWEQLRWLSVSILLFFQLTTRSRGCELLLHITTACSICDIGGSRSACWTVNLTKSWERLIRHRFVDQSSMWRRPVSGGGGCLAEPPGNRHVQVLWSPWFAVITAAFFFHIEDDPEQLWIYQVHVSSSEREREVALMFWHGLHLWVDLCVCADPVHDLTCLLMFCLRSKLEPSWFLRFHWLWSQLVQMKLWHYLPASRVRSEICWTLRSKYASFTPAANIWHKMCPGGLRRSLET